MFIQSLDVVREVERLANAEAFCHHPPLAATPRSLNEAGCPCPPMVRVVPKCVLQFLTVETSELIRDELEVLCSQHERLDFVECPHCPCRGREVQGGPRKQRPREKLLAAEVAGPQGCRVEESCPASVRGRALQRPPDDEDHLRDGIALTDNVGALGAQGRDKALTDGVKKLIVHLGEKRDLKIEDDAYSA